MKFWILEELRIQVILGEIKKSELHEIFRVAQFMVWNVIQIKKASASGSLCSPECLREELNHSVDRQLSVSHPFRLWRIGVESCQALN